MRVARIAVGPIVECQQNSTQKYCRGASCATGVVTRAPSSTAEAVAATNLRHMSASPAPLDPPRIGRPQSEPKSVRLALSDSA
jgi:hypothetical protein